MNYTLNRSLLDISDGWNEAAINKTNGLVLVAHPDDCVIFARNLILAQCHIHWKILYLTHSGTSARAVEVQDFWRKRGVGCRFMGFDDLPLNDRPKINNIQLSLVCSELELHIHDIDLIVTHNQLGEYGHPHHKLLYEVTKNLNVPKIYFGSFSDSSNISISYHGNRDTLLLELPLHKSAIDSFDMRFGFLRDSTYIVDDSAKKFISLKFEKKVPRCIHFVWLNDVSLPEKAVEMLSEWARLHPLFCIKVWSRREVIDNAQEVFDEESVTAIRSCAVAAMQSDIARLAIIHKYGGIYSDLKNFPRASFLETILDRDALIVTEHPKTLAVNHSLICNAFLAAPPENDVILATLKMVVRNVMLKKTDGGITAITGAAPLRYQIGVAGGRVDVLPQQVAWGQRKQESGFMERLSSAELYGQTASMHWSAISPEHFYN